MRGDDTVMGLRDWFSGRRLRSAEIADPADIAHLRRWNASRVGVEAYLEPETLVNVPSLCLVAIDGEWTRRPVGTVRRAGELAREMDVPLFDVMETKYPQRMRDFEEGRRALERRERRDRLREEARRLDGNQRAE